MRYTEMSTIQTPTIWQKNEIYTLTSLGRGVWNSPYSPKSLFKVSETILILQNHFLLVLKTGLKKRIRGIY